MTALQLLLTQIKEVAHQNKELTPELIAVSKTKAASEVQKLWNEGQIGFGENYVQELVEKSEQLKDLSTIEWHFIGHLQSNKIKLLFESVPRLVAIHSVDSVALARNISKRWIEIHPEKKIEVFLETNLDQEPSKSGFLKEDLHSAAQEISSLPGIRLSGLMCIPNPALKPKESFRSLRLLEEKLRPNTQGMLSMGMSGDYREAIEEGATHLRIGSLLFGARS